MTQLVQDLDINKLIRYEWECQTTLVKLWTYRSERGVQGPVTEAVLEEQVELLLHKTLHHHPEQEEQGASFVSYSCDAAEMEETPSF